MKNLNAIYLLFLCLLFSCGGRNTMVESLRAIIVGKDGKVIHEQYENGTARETLSNVQSLTKGIISILVGIAIDDGLIQSEEETIDQYFPEIFENLENDDKKKITLKHLLNQTSGL